MKKRIGNEVANYQSTVLLRSPSTRRDAVTTSTIRAPNAYLCVLDVGCLCEDRVWFGVSTDNWFGGNNATKVFCLRNG